VSGTGVGIVVGVGKVVGDGTTVGVKEAVCIGVGVRAFPHPESSIEINMIMVKVRSTGVTKTFRDFILLLLKTKRASLWNAQFI
jgi:hypothetical protein